MQLEKYQEQPQLLDPHIEEIVFPLMGVLRAQATAGPDAALSLVQRTCYALHALCNVRGYKTIVKFLPHDVTDLERTLALLLLARSKGQVQGEYQCLSVNFPEFP